jgi:hypothetical protein
MRCLDPDCQCDDEQPSTAERRFVKSEDSAWRVFDSRLHRQIDAASTVEEMDKAFQRYFAYLRRLGVTKGPDPQHPSHWLWSMKFSSQSVASQFPEHRGG